MDHILGGELAKAIVELHALAQIKGPFFEVRADLPLFRQARNILARLGVDVEQRLQKGVVLQMLGAGDGPETVALGEPGREVTFQPVRLLQCGRSTNQINRGPRRAA